MEAPIAGEVQKRIPPVLNSLVHDGLERFLQDPVTRRPLGSAEPHHVLSGNRKLLTVKTALLYELYAENPRESEALSWGDGLVRQEMHHSAPYPYATD